MPNMAQIRAVTTTPENTVCVAVSYGKQLTVGYSDLKQQCSSSSIVCHTKSFNSILRCVQFSDDGCYIVVCGDDKKAIILDPRELTIIKEKVLSKRPTAFIFTQDTDTLLIADKAGEVNRHRLPDMTVDSETDLMLGHSSIVLDMTLLSRGDDSSEVFIATCDRDEKVRVSHYPNGYNIHRYCLHHTSFVSCLCSIKRFPKLLLSGAGDGLICVWDWYNGRLLSSVDLNHEDSSHHKGDRISDPVNPVVVTCIREFSSKYDNGTDTANCLMAVTTSQYTSVLFYSLTDTGSLSLATGSMSPLTLPSVPWSMDTSRDTEGGEKLWVCVNDKNTPIQCFKVNQGKIVSLEADTEPILFELNKLSIAEGAVGCEVNWSDLQKHDYDNMTMYLAKKEERINLKSRGRCGQNDEDQDDDDGTSSREPKTMKLDNDLDNDT